MHIFRSLGLCRRVPLDHTVVLLLWRYTFNYAGVICFNKLDTNPTNPYRSRLGHLPSDNYPNGSTKPVCDGACISQGFMEQHGAPTSGSHGLVHVILTLLGTESAGGAGSTTSPNRSSHRQVHPDRTSLRRRTMLKARDTWRTDRRYRR